MQVWRHKAKILLHPLRKVIQPRRFHAYCIGLPKTGTHSMAGLLSGYRTAHEPGVDRLVDFLIAVNEGAVSRRDQAWFVRQRDAEYWLEFESNSLCGLMCGALMDEFPDSRFILTVREPRSWLESVINHQLGRGLQGVWRRVYDLRYRPDLHTHPAAEGILAARGLYTLDGYLSHWAGYHQRILQTIPAAQMMMVPTHQIGLHTAEIAAFLGVPIDSLRAEQRHLFKANAQHDVLSQLNQGYLAAKIEEHCGAVPQLTTLLDG